MIRTNTSVRDNIIEALERTGPCGIDDLVSQLTSHEWGIVFAAVDQMSRDGRLVLRRVSASYYQLSLPARPAADKEVYA